MKTIQNEKVNRDTVKIKAVQGNHVFPSEIQISVSSSFSHKQISIDGDKIDELINALKELKSNL